MEKKENDGWRRYCQLLELFLSFLALKTTFHVWQRRVMIDSSRTEDVGEEAGCNDCKNQYFREKCNQRCWREESNKKAQQVAALENNKK